MTQNTIDAELSSAQPAALMQLAPATDVRIAAAVGAVRAVLSRNGTVIERALADFEAGPTLADAYTGDSAALTLADSVVAAVRDIGGQLQSPLDRLQLLIRDAADARPRTVQVAS